MSASYERSVSVIVPAYNAEGTIEECVRSLLELRYPRHRLELRIVDNGSRDRTAKALSRYEDRVVVLCEQKRGAAAARNMAGAGEVSADGDEAGAAPAEGEPPGEETAAPEEPPAKETEEPATA